MLKVKITRKGRRHDGDTISIFDTDGREIAIKRIQIRPLRALLKDISKKDAGSLEYLETVGVVW